MTAAGSLPNPFVSAADSFSDDLRAIYGVSEDDENIQAAPLTSAEDASRQLDRTLDAMARRICVGVVLAVLAAMAYFARGRGCVPDSDGGGCGSLRWAAVALHKPRIPAVSGRQYGFECNDLLGIDRVALMFLSRGPLFHQELWRHWLTAAQDLLPLANVQAADCKGKQVRNACGTRKGDSPLFRQFLYSVYAHPAPDYSFEEGSIFYRREISERVQCSWGSTNLTVALQLLLRVALEEPRNQRFLLLSESGIPLYPAVAAHQALMGEPRSKVDACLVNWNWWLPPPRGNDPANMSWPVAGGAKPPVTHASWRKSAQWVGLIRSHAEIFAFETEWLAAFDVGCGQKRVCLTEEHYIPSYLSYLGLENETDCRGWLLSATWDPPSAAHPKSFAAAEISAELVHSLRSARGCQADDAIRLATSGFISVKDLVAAGSCSAAATSPGSAAADSASGGSYAWHPELLGPQCALFARKFPQPTAEAMLWVDTVGEPAKELHIAAGLRPDLEGSAR